ncbi:MAG TPA: nucleotidyltransferase domain-containing protein, partial [Pseudonocardia sp.]|nr:nucleotidyltransferase domain-containing protein [Pseudonocardia sp.]
DLALLYGDRLQQVLLFGSWARSDAPGEFDLELIVVLADLRSPWEELHRMDELLWRHTERSGLAITAVPVGPDEMAAPSTPLLVRAAAEAVLVA